MQSDFQIWQLILEASWLVKGVMAILLVASLASWMIIFRKRQVLAKAEKACQWFRRAVLVGNRPEPVARGHQRPAHRLTSGMERIFDAGFQPNSLRMHQQGRMSPAAMPWLKARSGRCGSR